MLDGRDDDFFDRWTVFDQEFLDLNSTVSFLEKGGETNLYLDVALCFIFVNFIKFFSIRRKTNLIALKAIIKMVNIDVIFRAAIRIDTNGTHNFLFKEIINDKSIVFVIIGFLVNKSNEIHVITVEYNWRIR